MKVSRLLVLVLLVSMVGCVVNPTRKAISEKEAKTIRSTQVVSIIAQDEITAHVVNPNISAAAGGGLLVALIDASIIESRTNEAEGFIAPLRQGLTRFDFRKEYWARQSELFQSANWMKSGQPKNTAVDMSATQIRDTVATMKEDAFLIMRTEYYLSSDFKRMVVEGYAQLWTKGQDLPSYAAKIEYQSATIPAENKQDAVDYWNKDGAGAALATLYEGMDEVVNILRVDLFKNKGIAIANTENRISLPYVNPEQTFSNSIDGDVIMENKGRYVIKANNGKLLSLVQDDSFKIPENRASKQVANEPVNIVAKQDSKLATPSSKNSKTEEKKKSVSKSSIPKKPVVVVSWAEPGSPPRYKTTSLDVYSRKLSGVMTRIIKQYSQNDPEIIVINGSSATHIADEVLQVETSKSLCASKQARYVVMALTGLTDADFHGSSSFSRKVEYHFHDCVSNNHRNINKIVELGNREGFRFEEGYTASFSDFIASSIFSVRNASLK